MPIFAKHFILDVWQGSEYYSGLLKLFYRGSKRDKQESWYRPNWLQYSLQMKNFPLFWSHAWKYNIQANKRLTKIKEKRSTIKLNVFVLTFIFFHLNVPDNKCQNKSGMRYYFFNPHQISGACAVMCTCDRTHQMQKTVFVLFQR